MLSGGDTQEMVGTLDPYLLLSYLQPTNEVWDKVMFLHLCVILFTELSASREGDLHPGGSASRGVCIQEVGGLHQGSWDLHPGGSAYGGSTSRGGVVCIQVDLDPKGSVSRVCLQGDWVVHILLMLLCQLTLFVTWPILMTSLLFPVKFTASALGRSFELLAII